MITVESIKALTIPQLVDIAGCAVPDSDESPGGRFIDQIRDGVLDAVNNGVLTDSDGPERAAYEIADGAPSVYTHTMWAQFVDLCAYQEDPTAVGFDGSDMTQAATACLCMIAYRLCRILFAGLAEGQDDESDES